MRIKFLAFAVALIAVNLSVAQDQTVQNGSNIGMLPNGIFSGSDFESVQLQNGNLHIDIPIWSQKGRGLGTGSKFIYDSLGWTASPPHCDHTSGVCSYHITTIPDNSLSFAVESAASSAGEAASTAAAAASRVLTTAVAVPVTVATYLVSPGTGGGEREPDVHALPPTVPTALPHTGAPPSQSQNGAVNTGPIQATSSSGPKAADAPGVSSSGQATDKYGNKLGGSGQPQAHDTISNTKEGARNRALNEGSTAVDHGDHYHAGDKQGNKKPASAHHRYPKP